MKGITNFSIDFVLFFCIGICTAQSGYLKIGDINGEATHREHRDWINIESFNQALEKQPVISGATRRRGSVILEDVVFSKPLDKATPKLMENCAKGKVFPNAILEMVAKDGRIFYKVTLEKVKINAVRSTSICDPDCKVMEEVSLGYSKITWEYTSSNGEKEVASYSKQTAN